MLFLHLVSFLCERGDCHLRIYRPSRVYNPGRYCVAMAPGLAMRRGRRLQMARRGRVAVHGMWFREWAARADWAQSYTAVNNEQFLPRSVHSPYFPSGERIVMRVFSALVETVVLYGALRDSSNPRAVPR